MRFDLISALVPFTVYIIILFMSMKREKELVDDPESINSHWYITILSVVMFGFIVWSSTIQPIIRDVISEEITSNNNGGIYQVNGSNTDDKYIVVTGPNGSVSVTKIE